MSEKDKQQIRNRLKILSQIEPSWEGVERAKQRVRNNLVNTQGNPVSVTARTIQTLLNGRALKFAAAAIILIGIGFFTGRLFVPAVDMEELQDALEPVIRQKLQEQWQQAYATGFTQIKDQLSRQFSRDLTEFAEQTLAASSNMTDQRINELVQLIEAARAKDRQWIAAALEHI
jgi:3'-phosphoadenosine 5'-phosphosulfate sulfotransferase